MLRNRKPFACFTAATLLACGFLQAQEQVKAEKESPAQSSLQKKKARENGRKKDNGARAKEFLRLVRGEDKQPISLQTAVTRYALGRGEDKVTVDLVSAVHVGDRSYYEELNKLFTGYDVVLYELVAPKGVRPVMGEERGGNPVSFLQNSMKSMLNLESQTALVNYQKKNFVHADMTPTEISNKMAERGDSGLSVALDVAADMIRQMNKQQQSSLLSQQGQELNLMSLLLDDNSDKKLKVMMAEQFVAQGSLDQGLGKTLNRMLVVDRNEAAMKVLNKELTKGRKKIAVFYGAAHMQDFERRLIEENGMRFKRNRWLTAWDLTKEKTAPETRRSAEPDPLKLLMKLLDEASK
ncbi:MAG: hypothetical protein AB8G99_17970 [Planctomycetaceae bacterium]